MSKLGLPLPSAGGDAGSGEVSLQSGRMKPASAHRREHARARTCSASPRNPKDSRHEDETVWDVSAIQGAKAAQGSI